MFTGKKLKQRAVMYIPLCPSTMNILVYLVQGHGRLFKHLKKLSLNANCSPSYVKNAPDPNVNLHQITPNVSCQDTQWAIPQRLTAECTRVFVGYDLGVTSVSTSGQAVSAHRELS